MIFVLFFYFFIFWIIVDFSNDSMEEIEKEIDKITSESERIYFKKEPERISQVYILCDIIIKTDNELTG